MGIFQIFYSNKKMYCFEFKSFEFFCKKKSKFIKLFRRRESLKVKLKPSNLF